ncbi:MAG: hypothetical protein IJY58_02190 [Alphaproteobacteria bacterium]|nr:hypothetical protein [Alphaproteobacteria bacterium]
MTSTFDGAASVPGSGSSTSPNPQTGGPVPVSPQDVAKALASHPSMGGMPSKSNPTPSPNEQTNTVAHANHEATQQQEEGNWFINNWKLLVFIVATLGFGYYAYTKYKDYKDQRKEVKDQNADLKSQITKLEDQIDEITGTTNDGNTNGGNSLANNAIIVNTETVDQLNNIFSGNSRI